MSHNVIIDNVKIASLPALRMAIAELQKEGARLALDETARNFRTYRGQPDKCDIAIKLPTEQFDIGLVQQPDGSYAPVFDDMLSSNRTVSCPWTPGDTYENRNRGTIGKLMQRYSTCAVEYEMAMAGHTTRRESGENGEIQLVVEYA